MCFLLKRFLTRGSNGVCAMVRPYNKRNLGLECVCVWVCVCLVLVAKICIILLMIMFCREQKRFGKVGEFVFGLAQSAV